MPTALGGSARSVSVISAEEIERLPTESVAQLLRTVPGRDRHRKRRRRQPDAGQHSRHGSAAHAGPDRRRPGQRSVDDPRRVRLLGPQHDRHRADRGAARTAKRALWVRRDRRRHQHHHQETRADAPDDARSKAAVTAPGGSIFPAGRAPATSASTAAAPISRRTAFRGSATATRASPTARRNSPARSAAPSIPATASSSSSAATAITRTARSTPAPTWTSRGYEATRDLFSGFAKFSFPTLGGRASDSINFFVSNTNRDYVDPTRTYTYVGQSIGVEYQKLINLGNAGSLLGGTRFEGQSASGAQSDLPDPTFDNSADPLRRLSALPIAGRRAAEPLLCRPL